MESSRISSLENASVFHSVRSAAQRPLPSTMGTADSRIKKEIKAMSVDILRKDAEWNKLLDRDNTFKDLCMGVFPDFVGPGVFFGGWGRAG